ncbi:DJ-1/PfpI family protein [Enterococcus sp. BWB1-3]|uniref:DJ-1/PfpI family protein n=1 Tax=unclassified Enterococcus TaxID=2608891 RepID=UPI001921B20D|nr:MULTISPECIES: DJ-1/PfpI family protein [unclassified Enterococcus]MBL1228210.1 DJ-1/PfpI family protein [Enterococcus sp. BWB1-3]MCB5951947.1 DJ-1/PfpI family protein [Enterococcus sp. BWT-B8]MCB5954143.1 DJ-1/PfpI family protein [Enterococcus sp. CWB-B31]
MSEKIVLLLLTDEWADWEASYAISNINHTAPYKVKTLSIDSDPKASIGGLRAMIDLTIDSFEDFEKTALLIIPGGLYWKESVAEHKQISTFIEKIRTHEIPIAAICGATIFLARHGFLDSVDHTGDEFAYFKDEKPAYQGADHFKEAQVVVDQGFITANETAAVDFAHAIYTLLKIDTTEEIEAWRDNFKFGLVR